MWKPPTKLQKIETSTLLAKAKALSLKYAKMPIIWVVVIGVFIYLGISMPAWERKSGFYELIRSGAAGYICLSHESTIFERSSMNKSYATTKSYIRFDRETFIKDFLKRDETSIAFLAVAVDFGGNIYWSEMSQKENLQLSRQYKIDLGTCKSANGIHYQIPGASYVTNN